MRRQLILVHRQFIDDAPLLIGALAVSLLLLLTLALLAFIYPTSQMLHVVCVLVVLPFLVGAGTFFLGVAQTRGDGDCDKAALDLWPITSRQLVIAQVITGMAFIAVVVICLGMAITGAALAGLVEWPKSLVPEGLIDLSIAMLLIGLACYCLGFLSGRRATSLFASLRPFPLALLVASLVVARGFGRPLVMLLVPLIAALLMWVVSSLSRRGLTAIVVGFASLVLIVIPLYWLRYSCEVTMTLATLEISDEASVTLYRDFRRAVESDPWVGPFTASGRIDSRSFPMPNGSTHFLLRPIGLINYLQEKEPGGEPISLDRFGYRWGFYYDAQRKLFIDRGERRTMYMGPKGAADAPTQSIGRFLSPVVCKTDWQEAVVFDRGTRAFYVVHAESRAVDRTLLLADDALMPVDIMSCRTAGNKICTTYCYYPLARQQHTPYGGDNKGTYMAVVDETGAITVLDRRTWTLLPNAGRLPRPHTIFGRSSCTPKDLFDYAVEVIVKKPEGEYAGLITASLPRQGVPVTVVVFDKRGRLLDESERGGYGLGPVVISTMKYLIESLHPPILTLASFFTAYSFDAEATHRAVFLLPNSIVALQRDRETSGLVQLLWALVFLLPAVLFSGFLAWCVIRDAAVLGLSRRERGLWLVGTLLFGLTAYVTYRLTRPKVVMAPCQECGAARRVDRDRCHRCGKGWNGPVLGAPAWRIVTS